MAVTNTVSQEFRHQYGNTFVDASLFPTEDGSQALCVLKSDIERLVGFRCDSPPVAFYGNSFSLFYERSPTLKTLIPERIKCVPGVIDIIQNVASTESVTSGTTATSLLLPDPVNTGLLPRTTRAGLFTNLEAIPRNNSNIELMRNRNLNQRQQEQHRQHHQQQQQQQNASFQGSPIRPSNTSSMREAMESFRAQPVELRKRILLYNKAETLLSRREEIYESKAPRLFVFLPDPNIEWDSDNFLNNIFRLYFLCECGHNSNTPTHLCTSGVDSREGEGILIHHLQEFLADYGPVLLVLLESLRLGLVVAGFSFEWLRGTEQTLLLTSIERAIDTLHSFRNTRNRGGDSEPVDSYQDLKLYLKRTQEIKLDQMGRDLKLQERDYTGGLYRVKDGKGYAKWLCQEHYRTMKRVNQENVDCVIARTEAAEGSFDNQLGRLQASPTSRYGATELYEEMKKLSEIQEIDITLKWEQALEDLINVRDVIRDCRPSTVSLHLGNHQRSEDDYPLLDILQYPSVRRVWFSGLAKFWTRSAVPAMGPTGFDHLKSLYLSSEALVTHDGLRMIKELLSLTNNLGHVQFVIGCKENSEEGLLELFNAVCGSRMRNQCAMDVAFEDDGTVWFCVRIPASDQWKPTVEYRSLDAILRDHGPRITKLVMDSFSRESCAVVLDVTAKNSMLANLSIDISSMNIIRRGQMAQLVSLSSVKYFEGTFNSDSFILKSIQWSHLTTLILTFTDTVSSIDFRKLLDGIVQTESHSGIALNQFALRAQSELSEEEAVTFSTVLRLLSVKVLLLEFSLTTETWKDFLKSINYSKLEILSLSHSTRTETIPLDVLDFVPLEVSLIQLCVGNREPLEELVNRFKDRQINLTVARGFEMITSDSSRILS